jgi:hypothetical protein
LPQGALKLSQGWDEPDQPTVLIVTLPARPSGDHRTQIAVTENGVLARAVAVAIAFVTLGPYPVSWRCGVHGANVHLSPRAADRFTALIG